MLADLVEIWRQTRSPRAAALIELLSEALPEPPDPPASERANKDHAAYLARAEFDLIPALLDKGYEVIATDRPAGPSSPC